MTMSNVAVRPPRAPLVCHKPSKSEEKYIRDGLAFLTMTTPFWSHVLYAEMDIRYTGDVPFAATDSHSIFVNVEGMKAQGWGVEEVAFVLAHEVCHYVFGDLLQAIVWRELNAVPHPSGPLPYDHQIMNQALDYRINPALVEAKVGKMPKIGLIDPMLSAKGMESAVEIYARLIAKQGSQPKSKPGQPGQGQPSAGDDHGGFDVHVEPSAVAVREEKASGAIRRAQIIVAAAQAAVAAGKGDLPAFVKRLLGDILEPKVKWQDHLRATMQRAAGEPRHDWSKVNKRLISRPDHKIVFARKSNYGCGTVVVGWDTSGSTFKWSERFFSEIAGILGDLNPAELILMRCDSSVHNVDRFDEPEDIALVKARIDDDGIGGGGGTSFVPVFDRIKAEHIEPDMLIYLTDTYGTFPRQEPDYPVVWASIAKNSKVPFGTLIEIDDD
jgi:predicted metal-dependent peptidase